MNIVLGFGISLILLGGFFNGSFVFPMKWLHQWRWENIWLVYSVVGLLIVPWLFAIAVVPHLFAILAATSWRTLFTVLTFGMGWGIGAVLFGLGISRLGLSVGYSIILGLNASVGTLLPLLVLYPEKLHSKQGYSLLVGILIVLGGILCCAVAARVRERALSSERNAEVKSSYATDVLICVLAGIFSPMLNFSFVFGSELQVKALDSGTFAMMASNAIWPLTLTAGFLVNAGYSVYLLRRNATWKVFASPGLTGGYWLGSSLIGLGCFASFIVYGMGATALGTLGGILGWPLFMSMSLITSNLLGVFSGEWSGAPRQAWWYSAVGLFSLIVAIAVISIGGAH